VHVLQFSVECRVLTYSKSNVEVVKTESRHIIAAEFTTTETSATKCVCCINVCIREFFFSISWTIWILNFWTNYFLKSKERRPVFSVVVKGVESISKNHIIFHRLVCVYRFLLALFIQISSWGKVFVSMRKFYFIFSTVLFLFWTLANLLNVCVCATCIYYKYSHKVKKRLGERKKEQEHYYFVFHHHIIVVQHVYYCHPRQDFVMNAKNSLDKCTANCEMWTLRRIRERLARLVCAIKVIMNI